MLWRTRPWRATLTLRSSASWAVPRATPVRLASGHRRWPCAEQNRIAAIHALVNRKDASFVARLSALLVPPEPLAVRQAIAQALSGGGYPPECLKNVLSFQERMANGARPAEDTQADPPRTLSPVEQELQSVLDEVLKK